MEPPVPRGSVEKANQYMIQRSHRPMADKAPKFARTPLSDLSDPSDRPFYPVSGTCRERRSHPLPSGGQRRENAPTVWRQVATAQP